MLRDFENIRIWAPPSPIPVRTQLNYFFRLSDFNLQITFVIITIRLDAPHFYNNLYRRIYASGVLPLPSEKILLIFIYNI